MKISTKQYAQGLLEALEGKKKDEVKQIIKKFVDALALNRDFKKADKIIEEYIKLSNEKDGVIEVDIKSTQAMDKEVSGLVKNYIKELTDAKKIRIIETEDKNLLGGLVLKYEDKIIDGSLKTKLSSLKDEMKK